MRIKQLKNKVITVKVQKKHIKAYKAISIGTIIVFLPLYALGWLLYIIQQFADSYCNIFATIISKIRDNIFKFMYFKECRDREDNE